MTDEAMNAANDDAGARGAPGGGAPDDHQGGVARDDHPDAVARDDHSAAAAARVDQAGAPLRLQAELEPRGDGRYRAEELFAFHDRAFVENAFRAALGRAPDAAELEATLSDLRAARRGKREIVEDLVFSEEGRRGGARARVRGVADPRLRRRVRALPVVGYLWQLLAGLARLPRLMRHQREFEAYALAQQQLIADRLNEQERHGAASVAEQLRLALERLDGDVLGSIADAREAVFMLSDALASLSARHAADAARYAEDAARRERIEAHTAARLDTHQRGIEELQRALNSQQGALEVQTRGVDEQRRRLDAQEEFLIQEQRAIVEAQKAALAEVEERLREAEATARRALDALAPEPRSSADAPPPTPAAREA